MEVQRRQVRGQYCSIWGHRLVLKSRFSGPCSWIMLAWGTAVERFGSSLSVPSLMRRLIASLPHELVLETSPGRGLISAGEVSWR